MKNFRCFDMLMVYLDSVVVLDGFGYGQASLEGQHDRGEDGGDDGDALQLEIQNNF
jgi:hypothetical protein